MLILKTAIILITLLSTTIVVINATTTYTCPTNPTDQQVVVPEDTLISLTKTTVDGDLCTLTHTNNKDVESIIPVARSYDANGEWEVSAGPYTAEDIRVQFDCTTDPNVCSTTLPELGINETYKLTKYRRSISNRDKVARFLEQATFGPTRELLNGWDYSGNDVEETMAEWINTQINTSVTPITSHREYFRRRINPRYDTAFYFGRPGPRPCHEQSRWRTFTLTRLHTLQDIPWNHNKPRMLRITSLNNYDDVPSTMPTSSPSLSLFPSAVPSLSSGPSALPTATVSQGPSSSAYPTGTPSASVQPSVTDEPTAKLSESPSKAPSLQPSETPSFIPTTSPSSIPTLSSAPSLSPTQISSETPTLSTVPTQSNVPTIAFQPGLVVSWFEGVGTFSEGDTMPDFSPRTPYKTEVTTDEINFPSLATEFSTSGRCDHVAALYTGLLLLPMAGNWTFETDSDDGSRLYINGQIVVDNGSYHPMEKQQGNIVISSSLYVDLRLEYFENGGDAGLVLSYKSPEENSTMTVIPANTFFHQPTYTSQPSSAPSLSGGPYLLRVDNYPLTIIPKLFTFEDVPGACDSETGSCALELDKDYQVCLDRVGKAYPQERLGGKFKLKHNGTGTWACYIVNEGNPPVVIDEDVTYWADNLIELPPLNDTSFFQPVDDATYESSAFFSENFGTGDEFLLVDNSTLNTLNPTQCLGPLNSTVPDPWVGYDIEDFPNMAPIFGKSRNELGEIVYLMYDAHLVARDNTIESPLLDGGGLVTQQTDGEVTCSNAPRSFMNEDNCVLSFDQSACSSSTNPEFSVTLDELTIQLFYVLTGRYIFVADNLQLTSETKETNGRTTHLPCNHWGQSRWLRIENNTECDADPLVHNETYTLFSKSLRQGYRNGKNQYFHGLQFVKDVNLYRVQFDQRTDAYIHGLVDRCHVDDKNKWDFGYIRSVDGVCWKNVHPHLYNVYDFTDWIEGGDSEPGHPGGPDFIRAFAQNASAFLMFPNSHNSSMWFDNYKKFNQIGQYGKIKKYKDLPYQLRLPWVAYALGYISINPEESGVIVCGSISEVGSDPTLGDNFDVNTRSRINGEIYDVETIPRQYMPKQRNTVWSMIALNAPDQLCQRIAWALAQIIVVSPLGSEQNEYPLAFYDIFVRNCYGSYRDILKEISSSTFMADWLTFRDNKSNLYSKKYDGVTAYADENFAREIMQLFSIGLIELNMDGTKKLDSDGNEIPTYSTDDILSFARAWTGYQGSASRGNVENSKSVDPLKIYTDGLDKFYRDLFPKSDLYGGFIGDGYPLCSDLPSGAFLHVHATYRLLGSKSNPELQSNGNWVLNRYDADDPFYKRVVLDTSSELYDRLRCVPNDDGDCTYSAKVVLDTNLNCHGQECLVDTVRVVQVSSTPPVFYEYVRQPCVEKAFFNNALKVKGHRQWNYWTNGCADKNVMCADPLRDVATEACCRFDWEAPYSNDAHRYCEYNDERMTYNRAQERCARVGALTEKNRTCDFASFHETYNRPCIMFSDSKMYKYWTPSPCTLQVKVSSIGEVAIVHNPGQDYNGQMCVNYRVKNDTQQFFMVNWQDGTYPDISYDCGIPGNVNITSCQIFDQSCLCDTTVDETAAFITASFTRRQVLEQLRIGAFSPDTFNTNIYTEASCDVENVTVFTRSGNCNELDTETIFLVTDDNGVDRYLKNMISMVEVVGTSYSFRNPVHFVSLVDPEIRDMHYETEAVLDHYFYHPNTAPFVSHRLMQRFGISNPSPKMSLAVATAFKTGSYRAYSNDFGSGEYGDLAATTAAILLHPEARSAAVESDPAQGSLREPILKIVHLLRAMEYQHDAPLTMPLLSDLQNTVGQCPYESPSVFSFFLPEFSPTGRIESASLVGPEGQVLSTSKIINVVEGFLQLIKYGLTSCTRAFGQQGLDHGHCNEYNENDISKSIGHLTFDPTNPSNADDVVNELATLLTAGRLSSEHRQIIKDIYQGYKDYYMDGKDYTNSNGVRVYDGERVGAIGKCDFYEYPIRVPVSGSYFIEYEVGSGCTSVLENGHCGHGFTLVLDNATILDNQTIPCTGGYNVFEPVNSTVILPAGQHTLRFTHPAEGNPCYDLRSFKILGIPNYYSYLPGRSRAVKIAQQIIVSAPEFHSTNLVMKRDEPRQSAELPPPTNDEYRAIVYVYLAGGADTYNMIVPISGCSPNDLYAQYQDMRGPKALRLDQLLEIEVGNDQPCQTFGINSAMPTLYQMYNGGEAVIFPNTGILTQPVTKNNWRPLTKSQLFSHNSQELEHYRIDNRKEKTPTGILGRIMDAVHRKGIGTGKISFDRPAAALQGDPREKNVQKEIPSRGVFAFNERSSARELEAAINSLNGPTSISSGFFAETWSEGFSRALIDNEEARALFSNSTFAPNGANFNNLAESKRFKFISRLIKAREHRGVRRDAFFFSKGGFDHHSADHGGFENMMGSIDTALGHFKAEMVEQGLWDNVAVIIASDFGRTLTANAGKGTDHGWAGNYFMVGGSVHGGKFRGQYPFDISLTSYANAGRGRMIPGQAWDQIWNGIALWLGADTEDLDEILPNRESFETCSMYTDGALFNNGRVDWSTCSPTPSPTPLPTYGGLGQQPTEPITTVQTTRLAGLQRKLTPVEKTKVEVRMKNFLENFFRGSEVLCRIISMRLVRILNNISRQRQLQDGGDNDKQHLSGIATTTTTTISSSITTTSGHNENGDIVILRNLQGSNETCVPDANYTCALEMEFEVTIVDEGDDIAVSNTSEGGGGGSSEEEEGTGAAGTVNILNNVSVAWENTTLVEEFVQGIEEDTNTTIEGGAAAMTFEGVTVGEPPSDFSWDINLLTVVALMSDSTVQKEVEISYNISNRFYGAALYQAPGCIEPISSSVIELITTLTEDSSSFGTLDLDLDIKQDTVQYNDEVWTNGTDPTKSGFIGLCSRVDLYVDETKTMSVTFHETIVNISISLEKGFSIVDIVTDRTVANETTKEVELDYDIYACQCNDELDCIDTNNGGGAEPLSQGSLLNVCVKTNTTTAGVILGSIKDLTLTQDNSGSSSANDVTLSPIINGISNSITDYICMGNVCRIRTQMISSFFASTNPGDIEVDGTAIIAFADSQSYSRRRTRKIATTTTNKRHLRLNDDNDNNIDDEKEQQQQHVNIVSSGSSPSGHRRNPQDDSVTETEFSLIVALEQGGDGLTDIGPAYDLYEEESSSSYVSFVMGTVITSVSTAVLLSIFV